MEDRVLLMTSAADEAQGREPDADVQEARRLYLPQDFSAFTRLHELTLTNMYGDLRRWKRLIVKILRNSPGLTKLSLSLSDYAVERSYHDGRLDDYVEFFTSLCDEYAQPNTPPLKLRSLECGTAIYPDDLDALEKLTDLSYLEEVHIDNTGVYVHGDTIILYDEDGYSGLVFDAFLSPRCPKLRRFSASELRTDVFDALCGAQAAKLTRQIAVSFDRQDMGDERTSLFLRADKEHPNLPLTLRMMDLDLDETADEDQTAEELLEDLVATNADTLDGLAVHLSLSLLGSAGTAEESSTSDLDLGFLNARLRRLPHLRQLLVGIIEMDRHFSKQEAAVRCAGIAENIARSVPQLRYICVCGTYWRIWRLGGNDSERPAVELERLDEARDRQGVELFAHSIYQCNWPDNRE
ncbi:hypothetical protein QBC47DRAFT_342008 [Echria macrotheca]|uniref:Uncharacterized protein n=1 Tax=Echria macrotheca TaxID=438768 RepID=A0AAJ0BEY5_9PEZI|nr:hypothetical protein QBC47DRAFT_342008 [Echria macrotheca]